MAAVGSTLRDELVWPSNKTVGDIALIAGIGLFVTGVQVLTPPALQSRLALQYHNIEVWALFTSAFVHHSPSHLQSNLVGYFVASGLAYGLARGTGRRRWFRLALLTVVVVGPVVITTTSYVLWTQLAASVSGESRGFSGIAGACVGLVYVALLLWIDDRWCRASAWWAGFGIYLLLMLELAVIYTGGVGPWVGLTAGVGFVLVARYAVGREWLATHEGRIDLGLAWLFVGLVVVLLGLLVFSLFPSTIGDGGSTTNIVAHGVGVGYGVTVGASVEYFNIEQDR
jgi:hypothetical protein